MGRTLRAMKPKVLFAVNTGQREEIFAPETLDRLESFADVVYHQGTDNMKEEELVASITGRQGLVTCWGSPSITDEVLEAAPELRIISHSAGSIRTYIHEGVFERGITVTNASSAIAVSVSETTLGLIFGSLRHLMDHNERLRGGKGGGDFGPTHELTGSTVGIVGMGEVGRRVMNLLGAFNCRILVYDPHRPGDQIERNGGTPVALEDLMAESDIVSIHAPNIPSNYHMITADLLGMLRDDALLVNTARGELIDEDALIREAGSGRIRAALDVFEAPAVEVAAKLEGAPHAILTPHIAGRSTEARRRQGEVVVEDLGLFFSGNTPKNLVTREMLVWMA